MSRTARRKHKHDEGQGTDLGIIITPMLDMAFQLLAFFIMTYHPPAREGIVDDQLLPAAQAVDKRPGKGLPTTEQKKDKDEKPPPKDVSHIEVWVRAHSSGQPWKIELSKFNQKFRDVDVGSDYDKALKEVMAELEKSLKSSVDKDLPLYIRADRALKFSYVTELRDKVGKLETDLGLRFRNISIGSK